MVTATGSYDGAHQWLVRERTVDGDTGYLVLTPLRTDGAPCSSSAASSPVRQSAAVTAPAPPAGR